MLTAERQEREDVVHREFRFRAISYGGAERWLAVCIDLDIFVQGATAAEVRGKLLDAVSGYLQTVLHHDLEASLIPRPAPTRYFLLWHLLRTTHRIRQYRDGLRSRMMTFFLAGPPNRLRIA